MDFQKDVLDQSMEIPVVVDFWAQWCGPCRILGPVLDALAKAQEGRWVLQKINTEEYPEISEQYRVMSIPAVKMFYKGTVIDEFVGALPRASIERWLDKALPDPSADEFAALIAPFSKWPDASAIPAIDSFLLTHPGHRQAPLALARHLLGSAPERVPEMLALFRPGEEGADEAADLLTVHEWLTVDLPAETPAGQALQKAREAFQHGDSNLSVKLVIEAVGSDKSILDGLPRRTGIALFHLLGNDHPITKSQRRLFDMSIY